MLLITLHGHMILQLSLSHFSFISFCLMPRIGVNWYNTTIANYFHSVLLYFCSRYPHRHQLCVGSHVRQFSLCGLILVSAFNLGLPKHHCRERSHLSQICLFCLALLLANFSLETDAVEFLNSPAALDAAAKA